MARLLSVNVGLPRDVAWQGRTVHTGIWKAQVTGPRRVRRLNIDGDGQGDTAGHGGEHRAVFVYQDESYRYWQEHLGRSNLVHGQFGENFTVEGLADTNVCIGDRYRIGSALFEVTQPRVTCYRLGIRMDEPDMAALLVRHGRPGFYFRVIEEGDVEAGDEINQVAAGPERMSVFEINALLYMPPHPRERLERALRIPALSRGWQRSFEALLEQQKDNKTAGNAGLGPSASPAPAWRGFRSFRVARKIAESGNVTSLILEPADGQPVAAALPGQFVVVRLGPSAMTRSYSLSRRTDAASYRISIKRETHGGASALCRRRAQDWRRHRARRATRQFHATTGGQARRPAKRGHRRHPGARHAPRARCARRNAETSGGCTAPATAASIRSPPRRAGCWRGSLTITATSASACLIRPIVSASISTPPDIWTGACSNSSMYRVTVISISAAPPPS